MNGNEFPKRGDIYWVDLDPTKGTEIQKTRPGLIVSNDEANEFSSIVMVAPITSNVKKIYPFQVLVNLKATLVEDAIRLVFGLN